MFKSKSIQCTVALLAWIAVLAACAEPEILLPHSSEAPPGVDFSGRWKIRPDASGDQRRLRQAIDSTDTHPIHVTEIDDPARANFCESVESAHTSQSDCAQVGALLGVTEPPYRIDSQCKYAAIARGDSPAA